MSCTSDAKIIENIDEVFTKNIGYETTLEMKIINDNKESIYKMKEKYIRDDVISLEILEPKESNGITIEYRDDKIFLSHANIRQSITLKAIKDFNQGILLVNFYENLDSIKSIEEVEIQGKDYYIVEYTPKERNKYNDQRSIYLKKRSLEPFKMEIKDTDGNTRVIIDYDDFKYIKDS